MAHNCKEWLEEGRGCSICNGIGRFSVEHIIKIQDHINWRISELTKQNTELNRKNIQLRIKIRNLQGQISKLTSRDDT
jgi:hypothetical protein